MNNYDLRGVYARFIKSWCYNIDTRNKREVKVFPTTDDPDRFKKLKECIIAGKRGNVNVTVQSVKFFKQYVIVKFKEFDNINDIEIYTKCDLLVTRDNAVKNVNQANILYVI